MLKRCGVRSIVCVDTIMSLGFGQAAARGAPQGHQAAYQRGVTSGGPPGGRSLSKDGTRADSAKDFAV